MMAGISPAQTFKTLFNFDGSDGANSTSGLVQGLNGELYGTTLYGGTGSGGTVFRITSGGKLTTLYDFSYCIVIGCPDGAGPNAGVIQATNGDFYGITTGGGIYDSGTVFRLTPSGKLTTLYTFCSQSGCSDGQDPCGGLVQASNGDLYGTTAGGGNVNHPGGTIFKITPSGTLTTLYSFCSQSDCPDGAGPEARLVQASDGGLYGTTSAGGVNIGGTIFKITPAGVLTTLYSFCALTDCPDGSFPGGGLIQTTDGDFYGTTTSGGAYGYGTVFKFTPGGTIATLHSFCAETGCPDGADPYPPLIQASDGNFYGTTLKGGTGGTIFSITPGGVLTTLYSFCTGGGECTDGSQPYGGVAQATNGDFYGTTNTGGTSPDFGTVFSLSTGLGPFVELQTSSGKVGSSVKILGTQLTGATSVTFDGTAATFIVSSATLITATVPTGANTGTVEVMTPNGTLSSSVPFRVRP
jgi:uncharacterized repeat protein (TIGR03803 family)